MTIEGRSDAVSGRIRLGMVGGGQGAFIGAVHRLAARMDDHYQFVAGALSSDPARARASGKELGLAADRIYSDFRDMAKAEASRKDGIEAVAIVTPNYMHFPAAKAFIDAGIHVICDKPMTLNLKEAVALEKLLAKRKDVIFALTHNYSGYPMIRQARAMWRRGNSAKFAWFSSEYPQAGSPIRSRGKDRSRPPAHRPAKTAPVAASATSAPMPISSPALSRA